MIIEIGKKYLNRANREVSIERYVAGIFIGSNQYAYTNEKDGNMVFTNPHEEDLIKEII